MESQRNTKETAMTVQEIIKACRELDRNELITVFEQIRLLASSPVSIQVGQKVRFKTRAGVTIEGLVTKVNRKSVKVVSKQNRYGSELPYDVTWTVGPSLIEVVK